MLHIKNLTITKSDGKQLFHQVSFHLSQFDKLAIIGEEGTGKSTLLKCIARQPVDYVDVSGEVFCDETIAYLPQQFEEGWEEETILDYLLKESPTAEIEIQMYNRLQEVERIWLQMNGSISFLYREQPIKTLSGGEKVKLQLLKCMLNDVTLLCLDEPSNDLDLTTLKWLEHWIQSIKIPCIFISHDEHLLKTCANHILHLEQVNRQSKCRHTFYKGTYQTYLTTRADRFAKEVQTAHNAKLAYQRKMEKMNDIANAVRSAQQSISRQSPYVAARLKSKMHTVNAMTKRLEAAGYPKVDTPQEAITLFFDEQEPLPKQKQIIQFQGTIAISGNILLQDISLSVFAQDKIVIVGDNGCGKTTLLRVLYEQLKNRTDLKVGYMPQNYLEQVDEKMCVLDLLCQSGEQTEIVKARTLLGCLNFTAEEMEHEMHALSDGQKAKGYLASFVMRGCNVLLLDEPTRNLSPLSQPIVHRLLKAFHGCVICVSHDRYLMKEVFETGYLIQEKQIMSIQVESLCE